MAARVAVGEVGVHAPGGRYVLLRPDLQAMASLGSPTEIVEIFARVMADPADINDARAVIFACAGDEDVSDIFGHYEAPGIADPDHMVVLARTLLEHGIVGVLPEKRRPDGETPTYSQAFDARDYVALGVAHLGLAESDVWQMTMTSLAGAFRAKFPDNGPGANAPSGEDHDKLMAWLDGVDRARNKKGRVKNG